MQWNKTNLTACCSCKTSAFDTRFGRKELQVIVHELRDLMDEINVMKQDVLSYCKYMESIFYSFEHLNIILRNELILRLGKNGHFQKYLRRNK